MNDLRVTSVQTPLFWEDEQANLGMLEVKLQSLKGKTDVIVLPEMFNSGFSMSPEKIAQPISGVTVTWMQRQAKLLNAAICGSIAICESFKGEIEGSNRKNEYFNRFVFVHPDGQIDEYNKRHCFRMSGEHELYHAGTDRLIISYRGWKILPLVCYDLRFPVFARNKNDYDLIIVIANWPQPRRKPWRILTQARAIENLAYVVAVNRIGQDNNQLSYSGDSLVVDYTGEILFDHAHVESLHTQKLTLDKLIAFRNKFPAHLDADSFSIRP